MWHATKAVPRGQFLFQIEMLILEKIIYKKPYLYCKLAFYFFTFYILGVGCHFRLQCMKVKSDSEVAQWCPTLSDPMDCSPPGSSVHGIFQARVLEWGAIAFSDNISFTKSYIREKRCRFQFNSVAQSCPTLCDPMNHSMPGLAVPHQLPESTQTRVH